MAENSEQLTTTWDAPTRRLFAIILAVAAIGTLLLTHYVWLELLLAVALVLLVSPLISFFQRRLRFPRWMAVLTAYLLAVFAFILMLLLIPAFFASFLQLGAGLANAFELLLDWLAEILAGKESVVILGVEIDLTGVVDPLEAIVVGLSEALSERSSEELIKAFGGILVGLGKTTISLLGVVVSIGWTVFLVFIYSVYITADDGEMSHSFVNVIPSAYRPELMTLMNRIGLTWRTYVRGQLLVMLLVGLLTTVVAWLLGLSAPLALGVIAGLLEIVPYFGPILATIPAVILAIFYGSTRFDMNNAMFTVVVIVAYILIQQVEDLYLTPRIHGKTSRMPPLVVMVSIIVAVHVAGIWGAIIAIPIVATGRELFNYTYAKVQKLEPYPELVVDVGDVEE